jgi:hypothetical protein
VAVLNGRELPLSTRHAEILTLLALHSDGMNAEQLALDLYGESGNPVTVRAEMHRLRAQLGDAVVRTRPNADVDADFLTVRDLLRKDQLRNAITAARGELLPRSDAPAVREERDELTVALRNVVLARRDPETLWRYAQTSSGAQDAEALEALAGTLSRMDARHALVLARLRAARRS